jgi:hypothetical protein
MGFISGGELRQLGEALSASDYGKYLLRISSEEAA